MKVSKRILAVLLSVLLLLPTFVTPFAIAEGEPEEEAPVTVTYPNADPDEPYYVVGYFQEKGTKVEGGSTVSENTAEDAQYPTSASMGNVNVVATTPIDLTGRNAADLALVLDITYTRADGVTGDGKLDKTGNQMLFVNNGSASVAQLTGSPYLTGFTTNYANAAGKTVTYMIPWSYVHTNDTAFVKDTAATTVDRIQWQVYNDSYKVDIDGNGQYDDAFGLNIAIENARIVDVTRDGEGYKSGVVAEWVGSNPVSNYTGETHVPAIYPWSAPQTSSMTAEMDTSKLRIEADVMYTGAIDASKIMNGQARFQADGKEYSLNQWSNGKTPKTDTWYHFEWAVSEFKNDGNALTDASTITRFYLFNYTDDKTKVNEKGEGITPFTAHVKNIRIVDTTVTGPREDLAVAVDELKNSVFDENDNAEAYDAAVAAGEALLADRDAAPADMTKAAEDIATAKAALTNIVDMSEGVLTFPGLGTTKKVADVGANQYYFNWSTAAEATASTGANLTDDGTTIGANRYIQLTLTLKENTAYTGDVVVEDLSALLRNVEVRVRTNIGGEKRTNSYVLQEVGGMGDEGFITLTMEAALTADSQHEVDWTCVRDAIVFVNLNQALRAATNNEMTQEEKNAIANSDIPVYCTLSDVKIVNKTAAVMKDELAKEADASVEEYEADEALTAYTTAQAAAEELLAGDPSVREVKAAAAELATLKAALTKKVDRTALDKAIEDGEAALADETKDYTIDTETALQNAIDAGKAVSEDADQAAVDAAAKAITDAIAALKETEPVVIDKAALNAKITEATNALNDETKDYTDATKTALQDAITAAQAVVNSDTATQDDVDAQVTALQAAIDGLKLKPVRTALDAAIADAEEKLDSDRNYTADTKAAVQTALDAAKAVAADADQATIDAATKTLEDAIDALVIDPILYVQMPLSTEYGTETEQTTAEAHGLWVYGGLTYVDENGVDQYMPIDLTPYIGSELSVVFKMKINATENLPEAAGEEATWIQYIRNGSLLLYTGIPSGDDNKWASGEGGNPYKMICGVAGNLAEDVNTTDFVEIEIPVPQSVIDAGQISDFAILMYNDLHALLGGTADVEGAQGVTMTVKDVMLKVDSTNKVDKTTLEDAIADMLSDEELVGYTSSSIAKYKALYDAAQAVLDDEEATIEEVVDQVNILKTAASVLVEDMSEGGEIDMITDELTSSVAHYMSVNKTFEVPYNFAKYGERESVKLSFDIRVNKDEATFPEVLAEVTDAEWIQYIQNGTVVIWTDAATDDYKFSLNQQTPPIVLNCAKVGDLLETAIVGVYSNVTIDLPAEIVAAGTISKIEIFLYNDMDKLNAEAGNATGVSISVKDVKLVLGAQIVADKTELKAAVDAEVTDFEGFTAESVAAYQAAMAEAKAVLADDAATNAQVAEALAALEAAVLVPEASYTIGNVDGSADGQVTANDALLALQIATGKVTATEDQLWAANVNGSVDAETGADTVTAEDALLILQYATQKITVFPVEVQE